MPTPDWPYSHLELELFTSEGITVAQATGDIDLVTIDRFKVHLVTALADAPRLLVVDLVAVAFMSSAGLQALLETRAAAGEATTVVVAADGPITSRPMQITGIDEVIPLYPTRAEALRHFVD